MSKKKGEKNEEEEIHVVSVVGFHTRSISLALSSDRSALEELLLLSAGLSIKVISEVRDVGHV